MSASGQIYPWCTGGYSSTLWLQNAASLRELPMLIPWLLASGFVAAILSTASSNGFAKDTGLIFVSTEKNNNVVVVDPETNKIVKHLKTSRQPRDMHFNDDHTKLYVACGGDDTIDIIDVAKLEVVGRLVTGPRPEAFAIDDKRRRIYVSNREESSLSVVDMDQDIIIHEVPTGAEPEGVFISEDGQFIYVTSQA